VMVGDGYVVANNDDSRILFLSYGGNPDFPLHNFYWTGIAQYSNLDVPNHDATKVQILEFSSHGTISNVRVNGVNSLTRSNPNSNPFEIDRIGMKWDRSSGVDTWDGNILEIIAVTSTTDREKIEGYLAHKWGLEADLPSDHNFKTSPPTIALPIPQAPSDVLVQFEESSSSLPLVPSDFPYELDFKYDCGFENNPIWNDEQELLGQNSCADDGVSSVLCGVGQIQYLTLRRKLSEPDPFLFPVSGSSGNFGIDLSHRIEVFVKFTDDDSNPPSFDFSGNTEQLTPTNILSFLNQEITGFEGASIEVGGSLSSVSPHFFSANSTHEGITAVSHKAWQVAENSDPETKIYKQIVFYIYEFSGSSQTIIRSGAYTKTIDPVTCQESTSTSSTTTSTTSSTTSSTTTPEPTTSSTTSSTTTPEPTTSSTTSSTTTPEPTTSSTTSSTTTSTTTPEPTTSSTTTSTTTSTTSSTTTSSTTSSTTTSTTTTPDPNPYFSINNPTYGQPTKQELDGWRIVDISTDPVRYNIIRTLNDFYDIDGGHQFLSGEYYMINGVFSNGILVYPSARKMAYTGRMSDYVIVEPIPVTKYAVGETTTWSGFPVTIISINSNGRYNVDTSGNGVADSWDISESTLGT